jgi:hypothetical protein
MTPHALVGRQVRVAAWDDLRDVMPTEPVGTITQVVDHGARYGVEVTVRLEGFRMAFAFGLDEVELLGGGVARCPSSDSPESPDAGADPLV